MDKPFGTEINLRNFLLQTFTRPISNIRSDEYVPFGRNMLFINALSFLVVPIGILRFSMYPHQQENDLSINILFRAHQHRWFSLLSAHLHTRCIN